MEYQMTTRPSLLKEVNTEDLDKLLSTPKAKIRSSQEPSKPLTLLEIDLQEASKQADQVLD